MSSSNCLSCRDVLWWMVFWGIAVNYMLRVNLNIVIVSTVKPPEKLAIESQCGNSSVNSSLFLTNSTKPKAIYQFPWNEYEQGLAIGAYYWIHWLSEIPGGILARTYGTKLVFGMGNLLAALLGFFLPFAMDHHLLSLVVIRALQGLVAGVAYPATHDMTAKWIPENERSKFVSAYMGGGVGIALTYPISGYMIDYLGWQAVFYVTSLLGIIWYIFWVLLVYDTPAQHPRISSTEKEYIVEHIGDSITDNYEYSAVPWKDILTSLPVWITILSNWSCVWGYYTLMAQAPAYFTFIHGWNIEQTGLLSGLPHLLTMIFSWIFAILSDWLLRTEKMTLTDVRKLATFACTGGPGLMILGLSFSGCEPVLAFFFMMAGIAITGAVTSGPLSNLVDLSPNYASILLGICGLIVDAAGFLSPILVGLLTYGNQSIDQWRIIFLFSAVNMGFGCVCYQVWGTAKRQPWNDYQKPGKNPQDDQSEEIDSDNS